MTKTSSRIWGKELDIYKEEEEEESPTELGYLLLLLSASVSQSHHPLTFSLSDVLIYNNDIIII